MKWCSRTAIVEPYTIVSTASSIAMCCAQVPRSRCAPKLKYVRRMIANTPDLTTATACSSAVTGVGATEAFGSQACIGKTAAFTPKPANAHR